MMEISSKVRYALLALLELARYYKQGEFLQIEQIAGFQQIPDRYLGQLLMMLRRSGLVRSQRGAKGGYILGRSPEQITLLEILTCLEGAIDQEQYQDAKQVLNSYSDDSPTTENVIVQEIWREATKAAMAVFGSYTLQDLCDKRVQLQCLYPMYYI